MVVSCWLLACPGPSPILPSERREGSPLPNALAPSSAAPVSETVNRVDLISRWRPVRGLEALVGSRANAAGRCASVPRACRVGYYGVVGFSFVASVRVRRAAAPAFISVHPPIVDWSIDPIRQQTGRVEGPRRVRVDWIDWSGLPDDWQRQRTDRSSPNCHTCETFDSSTCCTDCTDHYSVPTKPIQTYKQARSIKRRGVDQRG